MSWVGIGGTVASTVIGSALKGKSGSKTAEAASAYSAEAEQERQRGRDTEESYRTSASDSWKKFGEGLQKGQVFYDLAGDIGKDQMDLWKNKGIPFLEQLASQRIDATDRTPEEEALAANKIKTQYGQARGDARRALEFARNPGDPGYGDILGQTYGREAADVANAVTNARLLERERLAGIEKENYARTKGVYDIYGNLLTQGINATTTAGAGTQRTAGLIGNQATTFESTANTSAERSNRSALASFNAKYKSAEDQAAADARAGKAVSGIVNPLLDKYLKPIDATGGSTATGGPGTVDPDMMGAYNQNAALNLPYAEGGMIGRYAEGGPVEGAGSGTSDSISTEKKPGTYILSADTVRAMGEAKLTALMEKAGVRRRFGGDGGGEEKDPGGVGVRLSNGEWAMPPEVTKYHGEEFFNKLQQKFHRPVFAGDDAMANGGAIRKRRLPTSVEDAIFNGMPTRALGRRY